MPIALNEDAQKMVTSLILYFERERDNDGPLLPSNAVRERVAAALGRSICTVSRISSKSARGDDQPTNQERKKPISDIDDGQQSEIRNCIYEIYKNKEHITLTTLRTKLAERFLFDDGTTSFVEGIEEHWLQVYER